jgi:carbonic anhydrase
MIEQLFENNRRWAAEVEAAHPGFFQTLSKQQAPDYLWIGCSDSRVPANEIVALLPGELFVHRNVGNIVTHTDFNCLSVIQFAVEVLHVEHIIVCGHYGCGGIRAALADQDMGLIGNWLRHIRDIHHRNRAELDAMENEEKRVDRLCELNVIDQVMNVSQTTIVQAAWRNGVKLAVHGWIYGLHDGLVRDLGVSVNGAGNIGSAKGSR